ncbi:lipopolysaccharide biosynthesis protein [Legionella yabuuchiae]|uniref:lipopolysaccharide biosynthesis protein n=1 Tax=Legionella yabuuchiae TaxID=376727 RepID=UPI0010569274|nr:oligosaccharide flippase family protein [Legionella yabuuchiae]
MREEFKHTYYLFLLALIGYFIKYGLNVFLARNLEVHLYGNFSVAIRLLNILITIVLFGTNISSQRFLANYLRTEEKNQAEQYIAWNLKLIGLTSLLCIVLAGLSLTIMLFLDHLGVHDFDQYHLALYMFWIAPIAAFVILASNYFLSSEQVYFSTALSGILRYLVQLIFFAIAILFLGTTLDNITITGTLFLSFLFLAIFSTLTLDKNILSMMALAVKKAKTVPVYQNEWFPKSVSYISSSIIYLLISAMDLIIIEVFASNESDVGHYAAALAITGILWLLPGKLYKRLKPHIVSLLQTPEGLKILQQKLDATNVAVTSIYIILTSALLYFSSTLLSHFGPSYEDARSCVIILSLVIFLTGQMSFSNVLLIYKGHERLIFRSNLMELLALCLFVPPATIYYGINGTAAATGTIILIKSFTSSLLVRKYIHIRSTLLF